MSTPPTRLDTNLLSPVSCNQEGNPLATPTPSAEIVTTLASCHFNNNPSRSPDSSVSPYQPNSQTFISSDRSAIISPNSSPNSGVMSEVSIQRSSDLKDPVFSLPPAIISTSSNTDSIRILISPISSKASASAETSNHLSSVCATSSQSEPSLLSLLPNTSTLVTAPTASAFTRTSAQSVSETAQKITDKIPVVLIAEDNTTVQNISGRQFSNRKINFIMVASGSDMVKAFRGEKITIAKTNIQGLDGNNYSSKCQIKAIYADEQMENDHAGSSALEQIRKMGFKIKAYSQTSTYDPKKSDAAAIKQQLLNAGFNQVVTKEHSKDEWTTIIQELSKELASS